MSMTDLLYLGLRLGILSVGTAAGIAGIGYAWQIWRRARLQAALAFTGAAVVLFTAGLSVSNALRYLHTPTMLVVPSEYWLWGLVDALLPVLFAGYLWMAVQRDQALARAESLAITDELTGLSNRRGFLLLGLPALAQAWRRATPSALIVADIDHFKSINDRFGHAAGDAVLQGFGKVVHAMVRRGDVAGRTGGEEFALLLPGENLAAARAIAERLREAVAAHAFPGGIPVTMSCGVAELDREPDAGALAQAFKAADGALYAAKLNGRNRVEVALPAATAG